MADSETTLLRAFSPDEFQKWPSWGRLVRFLRSNGGSYGVSGPRGAGKTWHLRHAVHAERNAGGIGLWYPSPSEYESSAFLLALTETLANGIETRWRDAHPGRPLPTERSAQLAVLAALFFGLLAYLFLTVLAETANPQAGTVGHALTGEPVKLIIASLAAVGVFAYFDRIRRAYVRRTSEGVLLLETRRLKQAVRFSLKRREALEVGAQAGTGVLGKFTSRKEDELTERPLTLSTLIQDFRRLAEQAGEVVKPGSVVVAIDELDKMQDHEAVRRLLRDIKGIFDVPNVYFLVSVSHEAARALRLNGIAERNEFNSSFEDVLELPPLDVGACVDLLESRTKENRVELWTALGVLSGGIPRELVRLGEHVWHTGVAEHAGLPIAVPLVASLEALEFRNEVVSASNAQGLSPIAQSTRVGVFEALPTEAFTPERFTALASGALGQWSPLWGDEAWAQRFGEPWRRLMVRLHISGLLLSVRGPSETAQVLQDAIRVSAQSATVAVLLLKDHGLPIGELDVSSGVTNGGAASAPSLVRWVAAKAARLGGV